MLCVLTSLEVSLSCMIYHSSSSYPVSNSQTLVNIGNPESLCDKYFFFTITIKLLFCRVLGQNKLFKLIALKQCLHVIKHLSMETALLRRLSVQM